MKTSTTIIYIAIITMLIVRCTNRGMNYADLEHSDNQKLFEKKLMAQQKVIDSLAKFYKGKQMIVNSFLDFNGDPKKIILFDTSGYRKLDTLKPGDTIQLINVLPEYKFSTKSIVRVLHSTNTIVKTKKGQIGAIQYFFIEEFKNVLKEKKLETDTV